MVGTALLSRFEVAEKAIGLAHKISQDIRAPQGSALFEYAESARGRALDAMVGLCKVDPRDAYEILRLQKEIGGFADVMKWMSESIALGDEAKEEYEEVVNAATQAAQERAEDDGT